MAMDQIFLDLIAELQRRDELLASIAQKLSQIEQIGGGGSASIEDYEAGKQYTRNMLIVDPDTETVYRVLDEYTSVSIQTDLQNAHIKLVGFENQIIEFEHDPTAAEIANLPDGAFVATYSPNDPPYVPDT